MKDRLDRGQVTDADKDKLKETIRALKEQLDIGKEGARKGTSYAQACVTARENVQKWFMETGIRLPRTDVVNRPAVSPHRQ